MTSRSSTSSFLLFLTAICVRVAVAAETPAEPPVQPPLEAGSSLLWEAIPGATGQSIQEPDVIFVPTPQAVVDKMLEMAKVKKGDVVYDLGCGDGRIVVTAAKRYGVKAFGFDIDPQRVKEAQENVRTNQVAHLVTIRQADIFTLDLKEASVVTLYLLPDLNVRLMPQLEKLKPGSRILSHDFDMRGAKPEEVYQMTSEGAPYNGDEHEWYEDGGHTIYKWVVPWQKEEVQEPTD